MEPYKQKRLGYDTIEKLKEKVTQPSEGAAGGLPPGLRPERLPVDLVDLADVAVATLILSLPVRPTTAT